MFSQLAQGVSTVLRELSGEENPDGEPQDGLVPQLPDAGPEVPEESGAAEEILERLAHLEQLVVQLKEQNQEKDSQLASAEAVHKNERETAEARFTKLKLQAKAKMASLSKQVAELKGQEGASSPDSSFSAAPASGEEVRELRQRLNEEETSSGVLQERLQTAEQLLGEKDEAHTEQLRVLQAVVREKDARFQEQIQKHEEEILRITAQTQNDPEMQQTLRAAQRRCEELEEATRSRSEVLEMLQHELNSADQQKQILTAQFRQMEQELVEAARTREEERLQWAQQASRAEAELTALRASQEASEWEREELTRLKELVSLREAALEALQADQEALETDREQVAWLERELASLRAEQAEGLRTGEALAELWRGVRSLAEGGSEGPEEEGPVPTDPGLFLGTLRVLEVQLRSLKDGQRESDEHCALVAHNMETLQEQLDRSTAEGEEATAMIQQLEQQIEMMSAGPPVQHVIDPSVQEPSNDEKAQLSALEQQLLERDEELASLRDRLAVVEQRQTSRDALEGGAEQVPDQSPDALGASPDSPTALPDLPGDTAEDDTTLVADDGSVLSASADTESSPELIGPPSVSPVESKGTSSDEMVTSSDSEVAHSSWTLLEAVNQDGGQEWPSALQDFGQLQLQSWEETSTEPDTSSTVQVESSSVVIRETVQVHLSQQGTSVCDSSSDQLFAEALAEELQKRYGELLAEIQRLREGEERAQGLELEIRSLAAAKDEAESLAQNCEEQLRLARSQMEQVAQHSSSEVEKHSMAVHLLEEQLTSLQAEACSKEERIQCLLADLDEAQRSLFEQESQARMLGAQLVDKELSSTELEQKLQEMETSLLEVTRAKIMASSDKDTEISELQQCLTLKDQEIMELNDGMSFKLLQAEEEKYQTNSEIQKLKAQIAELENAGEETKELKSEHNAEVDNKLSSLQKDKEELATQLANLKKKFQAAMVQRKELMKKVERFEKEAGQGKEQNEEAPADTSYSEKHNEQEMLRMEALLEETRQALRTKEGTVETLEQRISEQDQALAETLALNHTLGEEVELTRQASADAASETTGLRSQVASLETECESLQKKLQDAQEARKDTIRKAKEKDRHHREQLKQQKDDYNELLERFEEQAGERGGLLARLGELEAQREVRTETEMQVDQETTAEAEKLEKPAAGDWVQEDWVDFAAPETESQQQQQSNKPIPSTEENTQLLSVEVEASMQALKDQAQASEMACSQLKEQLQEAQSSLSLKEDELFKLGKELEALRQKEKKIDAVSEEIAALKVQCAQAEALKAELEAAKGAASDSGSSIALLQAEVDDFKLFLDNKNAEIAELSQQLGEQNSLLRSLQHTVSEKDQLIASLQDGLRAEQEKSQKLEAEIAQKQEEKDSEAKIQQLQRKLQAALISRKEVLRENKSQKEKLAAAQKVIAELQQKMDAKEAELEKLRMERDKLIEEVDRTLVENQSLGASCESLKLAMEGMLTEKDTCKREAGFAKEEAARACREWEEKVQGMKDEYETLLKSYENVSDEAERVRRVLEAARQERQEIAARVRSHEAARQEAERQVEEAQKEVDSVKDKMRKFAKTKQQKIMDLEEENERLRELEEKKGTRREDRGLKVELESLKEEIKALKADLDATKVERDSLEEQMAGLSEQLAQELEKRNSLSSDATPSPDAVVEEAIVALHSSAIMSEVIQKPVAEIQLEDVQQQTTTTEPDLAEPEIHVDEEKIKMEALESEKALFEDKIREMEEALQAEKDHNKARQDREAKLMAELASLEQLLRESKEMEQSLREESSRREAQLKELHCSLEVEKDDLEERLMNQLAQLNGSIAGYQQEAADSRERLAGLQREVERLERERAELEAQAEIERDRAARLEEDKRQAQRERAEAEAESGKQRELEQKLKSAQRVREGSQSRARQLEELLREKQLEVRQMQKDCIQYQERISELGKEAKALLLGRDELQAELERARLETSKALGEMTNTEAELSSCRSHLSEAQKQASQALAEKAACEQAALRREAEMKTEAEQTLDSVRFRLGAELKQAELRLEESYREREREEEASHEARQATDAAERQAQQMQARLDESLARLAAFSRCMSSLQDDRDRVLDEAKQWESRFNSTLQGKEAEVQEAEIRAKELAEQLQKESIQREDLQLAVDRLQKADKEGTLRWEEEEKKFRKSQVALEQDRGSLLQALTQAESSLAEERAQLGSLETEAAGLRHRVQALEEAVGRLQGEAGQARAELREREAEERRLGLNVEQLETDLRSSKALTETLQTELSEKEKREVELLGEKEQAVTQAADEARREADGRARDAEKELEERREEVRGLEDRLRKVEEESSLSKARLDSFTKAMGSLQDDRDRVLGMYKQLEEKHLQVMMEKDGLIQEAAGENNSLKEELRALLVQRDDLHAEKAKLSAQLHGYRDDLTQVLSMKDSQHKQLLASQLERIAALERDREELDAKLRVTLESRGMAAAGEEARVSRLERETPSRTGDGGRGAAQMKDAPGAEVEKLREQLLAARGRAEALEDTLRQEREEQAGKAKELNELRWEGGVMRTESETAQERVAELARDLVTLEQRLLEEREASAQLRAQNQSFGHAMASLQGSRDEALGQAQELALRLEEMSKAGPGGQQQPPAAGHGGGEVWGLKNALQALQNDRERLLEQLQKQHAELARLGGGDVGKLAQDLDDERRRAEEMLARMRQQDDLLDRETRELETLRLERVDWQAQAELLKQQTLTALSQRDQQLLQLSSMLEEARAVTPPTLLEEHYQRQGTGEVDSAPGAPQQRSGSTEDEERTAEFKELQRRLDEEQEQRMALEERLMAAQDQVKRFTQQEWESGHEGQFSETAVLIEPPGDTGSRSRGSGPGLTRMLRVAFCSRQRTPLLVTLYLLTVHTLLLLCLGGYL